MKRSVEIEEGDKLSLLTLAELEELVTTEIRKAYPEAIGQIILRNLTKSGTKTDYLEIAEPLLEHVFKSNGINVYRLVMQDTKKAATMQAPQPMLTRTTRKVPSDSRPGHFHTIVFEGFTPVECSCESFYYNNERGKADCKHLRSLR